MPLIKIPVLVLGNIIEKMDIRIEAITILKSQDFINYTKLFAENIISKKVIKNINTTIKTHAIRYDKLFDKDVQNEDILTVSKQSEKPEHILSIKENANMLSTGEIIKKTNKKIEEIPIAFLINILPDITSSNPPLKKPPINGIEFEIAYLVARKLIPS